MIASDSDLEQCSVKNTSSKKMCQKNVWLFRFRRRSRSILIISWKFLPSSYFIQIKRIIITLMSLLLAVRCSNPHRIENGNKYLCVVAEGMFLHSQSKREYEGHIPIIANGAFNAFLWCVGMCAQRIWLGNSCWNSFGFVVFLSISLLQRKILEPLLCKERATAAKATTTIAAKGSGLFPSPHHFALRSIRHSAHIDPRSRISFSIEKYFSFYEFSFFFVRFPLLLSSPFTAFTITWSFSFRTSLTPSHLPTLFFCFIP